jgi:hypothetical protein
VIRVAADLVDSAAAEGGRQSRSAKQQLDHWARVGRAVSSQHSASRRRVEAALAGSLDVAYLTVEEGVVFNSEVAANLHFIIGKASFDEKKLAENYGAALDEVLRAKPSSSKGRYLKKVTVSTTTGPGIPVDPAVTRNFTEEA